MSENKALFTAVLTKPDDNKDTVYYFENVRTRSGDIIKEYLIPKLTLDDREKLDKSKQGLFIAFLAHLDFKNIELMEP